MSKVIYELRKWVNGNSLLVVTIRGLLLRLYCPLIVECIADTENFSIGQKCIVSRVGLNAKLELVYIIRGIAYSYRYFKIIGRA